MFFKLAQGLPYISDSFEVKFVTKNFLKIAQSGHTDIYPCESDVGLSKRKREKEENANVSGMRITQNSG